MSQVTNTKQALYAHINQLGKRENTEGELELLLREVVQVIANKQGAESAQELCEQLSFELLR
ncbi:hypothetical protein C9I98_06890 [Photobacterium sanctipauli]|uniref:Uncharacterized protein n=1 Tax=Photobacterium sanctipauli TaxID=1342794 RepID=A0A2T3NWA5_9GAMM|nr:hypothetical protein [Photobacterium sanctipauli]PSW20573.1 hypothetical protein C9I98_06890 [Photobacterium sanctipauli]